MGEEAAEGEKEEEEERKRQQQRDPRMVFQADLLLALQHL
jgi:hypothetical protein